MPSNPKSSSFQRLSLPILSHDDDDDFQVPLSQPQLSFSIASASKQPLKPSNNLNPPRKRPKRSANPGKENVDPNCSAKNQKKTGPFHGEDQGFEFFESFSLDLVESSCFSQKQMKTAPFDCEDDVLKSYENCSLDLVESSCLSQNEKETALFDCNDEGLNTYENCSLDLIESSIDSSCRNVKDVDFVKKEGLEVKKEGYLSNSIEARLIRPKFDEVKDSEEENELDLLIKLCNDEMSKENNGDCLVQCPICGIDISNLNEESKLIHTNDCLDKEETYGQGAVTAINGKDTHFSPQIADEDRVHSRDTVMDVSPVIKWLRNLGLERYEEAFVREEIDWDSLKSLTEEDLFSIGVTALGPRKKIAYALTELRKGCNQVAEKQPNSKTSANVGSEVEASNAVDETSKQSANKLITDYFPGPVTVRKKTYSIAMEKLNPAKNRPKSLHKRKSENRHVRNGKPKDIPLWCIIPGTPFRVDAFKYLRGDCSHWFLTHFHMDHYQGLTRSFCHGKIYCSLITARLVNMKIGIPWDRLQVLPLNQKINIDGVDVTCLDANHCPGSIILLFEPPNGKVVLHTGDFRFCDEMANILALQMCRIHTLILDTTYCNPQYDFPKQEAVIQFVIEAIQAESFNPKTLFLIGSYTIGKERLFLEAARVLHRKIFVTAAKFRLLESLGFSQEDMQWFTLNEHESQIHVVPMWTLASFKRLKHISKQYEGRFSLIVAFSPTGWAFGKGKKKSPGRKWRQGTIIRYEVPYSEHCSFTELREFVKLVSPEKIIPSVNNDGPESVDTMVSLLLS